MPKGKAKEEEKQEESEYDSMDLEMLREVVPMLRQQLEKSMLDRNYVQLERDSIQEYYNISRREVKELSLAATAKDREMELMEVMPLYFICLWCHDTSPLPLSTERRWG